MPAEPKLTPWIDWPTEPTLEGWYDARLRWLTEPVCSQRLWWNGRTFQSDPGWGRSDGYGFWPGDQWRGLAEKPKEQGNAN